LNSVLVALLTMALSILLGAPAGYALARFGFAGKDGYRLFILLTRAFPIALLALPLTIRFIELGIYDTILAVALVHTALALPFAILVSSSLFLGIPRELEEAAWTLGCSRFGAFARIVWPLARPGIAATAIFAFVISWNEVFAAAVLTLRNRTLPAYLLTSLNESPLEFRFAGGLFLIVPALVFIFVVRRYLFSMWGIANR
jgi:multiple sugar transport system permease protein